MLTLKQIFKNTMKAGPGADHEDRFDRASRVKIADFKVGRSKSSGVSRFLCRTVTPVRRGGRIQLERYVTVIDYLNRKYVKLSCSCSDFWSRWEWALANQGAADILYGNGEPPDVRNSPYLPGCCKHVIKMADYMVRNNLCDNQFELDVSSRIKSKEPA